MSKKKRRKSNKPVIIMGIILPLLIIVAVLIYGKGDNKLSQSENAENVAAGIEFPLTLEDGALEIGSLFQFTGINPDCNNQKSENVAAIMLTNLSDVYLAEAQISMTLEDGTELQFYVTDLPAGMATTAISVENTPMESTAVCKDVDCEAVFDEEIVTESEQVEVQIEGTQISLTNVSEQEIIQMVVYCHNTLGKECFGGISYPYMVENLAPGKTEVINAQDCFLGMAEVVRLEMK